MCEYCEGKKAFNAKYIGKGTYFYKETIARIRDGVLFADTSSGEYASMGFKINFCPKCGAKLKTSNKGQAQLEREYCVHMTNAD